MSDPGRRQQQGALGPAGQRREGWVLLTAASFDKGTYEEIEVPLGGNGWMSGAQILQRVP